MSLVENRHFSINQNIHTSKTHSKPTNLQEENKSNIKNGKSVGKTSKSTGRTPFAEIKNGTRANIKPIIKPVAQPSESEREYDEIEYAATITKIKITIILELIF